MNDIARAAGVSKGTLYVYFKHKEELFEAIVEQECEAQAEGIFDLDPNDHDVEAVLTRLGIAYVKFLCRPEKASAIRTVIAIAERMPELGRQILRKRPGQRHRAACRLYRGAGRGRRAGRRGLRNRRRAAHGSLPGDDVQIDGVQFRRASRARSRSSAWCGLRSKLFLAAYRAPARLSYAALSQMRTPRRASRAHAFRAGLRDGIEYRMSARVALPEETVVDIHGAAVRERQHDVADDLFLLLEIVLIGSSRSGSTLS